MVDKTYGLKQTMPGVPREWVERLVASDDKTDSIVGSKGTISAKDGGVAELVVITARKSAAASVGATNAAVIEIIVDNADNGDPGVVIRNQDSTRFFSLRPNAIVFVPKDNVPAPSSYGIGVQIRKSSDTQDGGHLWVNGGGAQNAVATGGNVLLFGGFGGLANGSVQVGPFNTSVVEVGAVAVPVDIKGELTIGGIKFLVVTATPNGSVTAPIGSIATNSTDGAFYSNTDGGTTWVVR